MSSPLFAWAEQIAVMGGIATLVVMGVRAAPALRARLQAAPRAAVLGVAAAALIALVVRLFVAAPAFVHGDFQGPLIVEGVLGFPSPPGPDTYGQSHGSGSFVVLGLLSLLTGRTAEGVLTANVIVSALATLPLGVLAARLCGRPWAGVYAAALWAASPLVARIAHSEDAHVTGVFFALVGLAAADVAAAEGSRRALKVALIATLLAVFSRQTFYPFALLTAGFLLERAPRKLERGAALGAAAVLLLACVARVLVTAGSADGHELVLAFGVLRAGPSLVLGLVAEHPLFSVEALPVVVPLLAAIGMVSLARRCPAPRSLAVVIGLLFLLTLPASFPSVGVRWSFRLPLYALALVSAGAGAAAIQAWLEQRSGRAAAPASLLLAGAAALVLGGLGTAWRAARAPNVEFVEYTFLRGALADLPRPVTLIGFEEEGPAWRLPRVLGRRAGIPVIEPERLDRAAPRDQGPFVMFEGIGCYARSVPELASSSRSGAKELPGDDEVVRLLTIMLDRRHRYGLDAITPPVGPRAACARVIREAAPIGPEGPVVELADDPPMAVFGDVRRLKLRLVRWEPAREAPDPSRLGVDAR